MSEHEAGGRGDAAWVIGIIAATLAEPDPSGVPVDPGDVAEAAQALYEAACEGGDEHVLLPDGVWALSSIKDGEILGFARDVIRDWLERHHLAIHRVEGAG
jgi:hypothetical protein